VCLLDIDLQGVLLVKKTDLNPYYVFISPPSMEELERRLRGRGDTEEDAMQQRCVPYSSSPSHTHTHTRHTHTCRYALSR
jgi:guanylate kinase